MVVKGYKLPVWHAQSQAQKLTQTGKGNASFITPFPVWADSHAHLFTCLIVVIVVIAGATLVTTITVSIIIIMMDLWMNYSSFICARLTLMIICSRGRIATSSTRQISSLPSQLTSKLTNFSPSPSLSRTFVHVLLLWYWNHVFNVVAVVVYCTTTGRTGWDRYWLGPAVRYGRRWH